MTLGLFDKYCAALFAFISFLVQASSAIGTASAIVLDSSFGSMFDRAGVPPLRAGAGATVIDKCNQIIETTHGHSPEIDQMLAGKLSLISKS